jgi:hypothetical protein
MDADRFASLLRALCTTPTRRAVTRALVGLAAGSVFAPLLRLTETSAKGKRGKRRRKKRKKDKPKAQCPAGTAWCAAGQLSECCSTAINPAEGEPYELCLPDCGCCDLGFTNCCPGRGEARCCKNTDKCSYGTNFEPYCCPEQRDCGGSCCPEGYKCCHDLVCCPETYACCPGGIGCCGGLAPDCCPDGQCRPSGVIC